MNFSAMYRLHWYRRVFTRNGASNKCVVVECVKITRQMALRFLRSSLASFFVFR